MQSQLSHDVRRALESGLGFASPDLVSLACDGETVCNTVDVLDALLGGEPFFAVVQLLDGLADDGFVRPHIDHVAHLLGTICCAEGELQELIEAFCIVTEHGVKLPV